MRMGEKPFEALRHRAHIPIRNKCFKNMQVFCLFRKSQLSTIWRGRINNPKAVISVKFR